jgi:predicted PurR-regulated permease PerM
MILLGAMYLTSAKLAPILFALFITALLTPIHRWFKQRMPVALATFPEQPAKT